MSALYNASRYTVAQPHSKNPVKCAAFAVPRKEVIKMPEEMLSFIAGGSTHTGSKPVAYDAIEATKSEIRKIVHDAKVKLPTSSVEGMVQRSSIWLLDVAMARSVMGGKLWGVYAEGGKRYTQALYLSVGFGDYHE